MTAADKLPWLELPERDQGRYLGNSLLYGAGKVAGAYAGLRGVPEKIRGEWIHGWYPQFLSHLDPDLPFGGLVSKGLVRFVATKHHEDYFVQKGLPAKAIGLPIAYLPQKTYQRRAGTLLVMPVHSETSTVHKWKFQEYAQQIAELKSQFEEVVACLHTSCLTNGYWVNEFKEIGVPVIEGAHGGDRNSLERIRALMSQFEFMTTNGFGSHIAYAAAFGAKVSIYGNFCNYTEADYAEHSIYATKRGLLRRFVYCTSETCVRANLGELFTRPLEAQQRVEWGLWEIGSDNRISPAEMRKCFGWECYHGPLEKMQRTSKLYFQKVFNRLMTHEMRTALAERRDPALTARNTELRRLEGLAPDQMGVASLDGEIFHFVRSKDFLKEYRAVFQQEGCAFFSARTSPVIVDWGASIGIPTRLWARQFPTPTIHVYSVNADENECLRRNAALATNASVVVHEDAEELTGLLEGEVDFLRINLGNDSASCLLKLGERLKSVKRCLVVCQTEVGRAQSLSRVLALLEHCGFRYHLQAPEAASNPMTYLPIKDKADCFVNIWAYRGEKFPYAIPENDI